jgi:hypothetical protein
MGSPFPLTPAGVDYLPLLLRMKLVSRINKLKATGILRLRGGSVNAYFSTTSLALSRGNDMKNRVKRSCAGLRAGSGNDRARLTLSWL